MAVVSHFKVQVQGSFIVSSTVHVTYTEHWNSVSRRGVRIACIERELKKQNTKKLKTYFIMVCLTTASRVLLRKWKTNVTPNLREWLEAMVETLSYEIMLHKLKGKEEEWPHGNFKSFTRQTSNWLQGKRDPW